MKRSIIFIVFLIWMIAVCNAQSWEELGVGKYSEGVNARVFCMTSNGSDLYIGGEFTNTTVRNYVAKWNGVTWEELGKSDKGLNANGNIYSLVSDEKGNVYAAGDFRNGEGYYYVAKWNGLEWEELRAVNSLNANNPVFSLAVDGQGNIYAAGNFKNSAGHVYVARWDGSKWSELGSGSGALKADNTISAIIADQKGNVYAAGSFTNSLGYNYVSMWNGSSWNEIGDLKANAPIKTITFDISGNLLVGGHFAKPNKKKYIARWDGNVWSELASPVSFMDANDFITSIVSDKDSNIYAGGAFFNINGKKMILKWDGYSWTEQNYMISDAGNQNVQFMHADAKGAIYTAQTKNTQNSLYYISVLYEGRWQTLDRNMGILTGKDAFYCLAKDKSGNIYTSGGARDNANSTYYITKFNGKEWVELCNNKSSLKANNLVFSIASDSLGNIYAGGAFTNIYGENMVAKWDGKQWTELGRLKAKGNIRVIVTDKNNHVYVAGEFMNTFGQYYIAHWDGNSWKEFGVAGQGFNGAINAMIRDEDTIYAGGAFKNTDKCLFVAKWNGVSWVELGVKSGRLEKTEGEIYQIVLDSHKCIYTAGSFYDERFNQANTYNVYRWDREAWRNFGYLNAGAPIRALAIDKSGKLYAAGDFMAKSTAHYVAVWNGVNWEGPDDGVKLPALMNTIQAMIIDRDEHLLCVGDFKNAKGFRYVAIMKDQNWDEMEPKSMNNTIWEKESVLCLVSDKKYIYAAGELKNAAGRYYVAAWDGFKWNELKNDSSRLNADSFIYTMACGKKGELYVAGAFRNQSGKFYVSVWDGKKWLELGTGPNALNADWFISSLVVDSLGKVYAAGRFRNSSGNFYVAVWDGQTWGELGAGSLKANGEILTMVLNSQNELFVAGDFRNVYNGAYISRYSNGQWVPIANNKPVSMSRAAIRAMAADTKGNVYAVGSFDLNSVYNRIVKWDGKELLEIKDGPEIESTIYDLEVDRAGNLYVAGNTSAQGPSFVFKWFGTNWMTLDNTGKYAPKNRQVFSLLIDEDDHLHAAGSFINEQGKTYVAKWSESNTTEIERIEEAVSGYLSVYPNPVSGILSIESGEDISWIQVYNQLGQEVIASENAKEIDVSSLVPGIYIVRAKTMNGDWLNTKFIRI
jgi:hypothetical protein